MVILEAFRGKIMFPDLLPVPGFQAVWGVPSSDPWKLLLRDHYSPELLTKPSAGEVKILPLHSLS